MIKRVSQKIKSVLSTLFMNSRNVLNHGLKAPRHGEILWVNPQHIRRRLSRGKRTKYFGSPNPPSGIVIDGTWEKEARDLYETENACREHYLHNVPWVETEKYKKIMMKINTKGYWDGCFSREDVMKRYENLDNIYKQIKKEGTLRTEGVKKITVCIASDGSPIHAGGGQHRLAISKILGIEVIPVKVGVVHPDGIKYLNQYRLK